MTEEKKEPTELELLLVEYQKKCMALGEERFKEDQAKTSQQKILTEIDAINARYSEIVKEMNKAPEEADKKTA